MNHKNQELTLDQGTLNWLLEFLEELPEHPVGNHLPDDIMSAYVRDELPAPIVEQMDRHLASCEECAAKMEWLLSFTDILTEEAQRRRRDEEAWKLRPVPAGAVPPEDHSEKDEGRQGSTVALVALNTCQVSAPVQEPSRSTDKAATEICQLVQEFRSGNDREVFDKIFQWCLKLVEHATLRMLSREDCFDIVAEVLLNQRENLGSPDLEPELATQQLLREITRRWQLKRATILKPQIPSVALWGDLASDEKNSLWAVTTLLGACERDLLSQVRFCSEREGHPSLVDVQFAWFKHPQPEAHRESSHWEWLKSGVLYFGRFSTKGEGRVCRPSTFDGLRAELYRPLLCSQQTWGHVAVAQHTLRHYVHRCGIAKARGSRGLPRSGWRDIFSAVECGDLESVKACVQEDPAVLHQKGPYGISLLEYALAGNHGAVVEWLTTQGCYEITSEG
jgi:hypothetical protein